MLKRLLIIGICGIFVVASLPTTAFAVAQLKLTDLAAGPPTSIIYTDNLAGDIDPDLGVIHVVTPLGTWVVSTELGLTKPTVGYVPFPLHMHLHTLHASSQAATILVEFTDEFTTEVNNHDSVIGATSGIGGLGGTVNFFDVYYGDAPFTMHTLATSIGPIGFPPNGSATGNIDLNGFGIDFGEDRFFLNMRVEVTHTAGGLTTSYDADFSAPEPATLAILGIGLAGIGFINRKRKA